MVAHISNLLLRSGSGAYRRVPSWCEVPLQRGGKSRQWAGVAQGRAWLIATSEEMG